MGKPSPLTLEERKIIEEKLKEKLDRISICKLLGRSQNTIYNEIIKTQYLGEYNAEQSHKLHLEHAKKVSEKRSATMRQGLMENRTIINRRLENLEMQIEVILDHLKKLEENK